MHWPRSYGPWYVSIREQAQDFYNYVPAGFKAKLEKWEWSSRLSLFILKRIILETTYGGTQSCNNFKDFLEAIGQKFRESYMVEISNVLNNFFNAHYNKLDGLRNYNMKIVQIANKVMEVNSPMTDHFVV